MRKLRMKDEGGRMKVVAPARLDSSFILYPSSFSPAFTLIELLAVLVIVGLLLATFVPYALSLRESSNRVRCVDNLTNISRALRDYAASNNYFYPRVKFDAAMGNRWAAFTGADDANPFAADSAVSANDVTASLWLLVREGLAKPEWFVCPSGGGRADPVLNSAGEQVVVKKRGNFRSPENLGYGYATPFSSIDDYRLNDTLPARFALLADRPPMEGVLRVAAEAGVRFDGPAKSLRRINSPNHGGAGQNVLYADGTVRFEVSPYCGVRKPTPADGKAAADANDGDNIYTALAPAPLVSESPPNAPGVAGEGIGPSYRYDTVILPIVDLRKIGTAVTPNREAPRPAAAATAPATSQPATSPTTQP
jgi:prepilin-type N-terminal cleavage/methylation domain-containing protein